MNNNFNLDENTMNNIKNMVDNGDFSGAISQISPEMIENVSKMLNNQKNSDIPNNSNQNNFNNSGNLKYFVYLDDIVLIILVTQIKTISIILVIQIRTISTILVIQIRTIQILILIVLTQL